jgi:hypothetical protein
MLFIKFTVVLRVHCRHLIADSEMEREAYLGMLFIKFMAVPRVHCRLLIADSDIV